MDMTTVWMWALAGLVVGGGLSWWLCQMAWNTRLAQTQGQWVEEKTRLETQLLERTQSESRLLTELKTQTEEVNRLGTENTTLALQKTRLEERLQGEERLAQDRSVAFETARQSLTDTFKALSADTLKQNSESFLKLATSQLEKLKDATTGELNLHKTEMKHLVDPLKESLNKVDIKIQELEKARTEAYTKLDTQITQLVQTQNRLQSETGNLVKALKNPSVRGQWGEMHLKRVVELAGMLEYCDFELQHNVTVEDARLRPDMIIRLPNRRVIAVDAKTPLDAYTDAITTDDESVRKDKLAQHARQVKENLQKLSSKAYWNAIPNSPDFVVMFLPGESIFSEAVQQDPKLIELATQERVLITTPTTLIALLKAVAYGWQEERMAQSAEEIRGLGKELYERLSSFLSHYTKLGSGLKTALDSYNSATGSLERRVLVTARRFKDLAAFTVKEESKTPELLDQTIRPLQVEEAAQSNLAESPQMESATL